MILSRDNIWYEWLNMFALIYGRADIFIQQILSWQIHQNFFFFFFFFCRTACNYCSGRSGAFLDILPCRLSSAGKTFLFIYFLVVFILTLFWILSSISNDFNISKLTWFFKSATSFGNYEGASFSIHIFIFLFYWTIFWHLMELILTSQYLQF